MAAWHFLREINILLNSDPPVQTQITLPGCNSLLVSANQRAPLMYIKMYTRNLITHITEIFFSIRGLDLVTLNNIYLKICMIYRVNFFNYMLFRTVNKSRPRNEKSISVN